MQGTVAATRREDKVQNKGSSRKDGESVYTKRYYNGYYSTGIIKETLRLYKFFGKQSKKIRITRIKMVSYKHKQQSGTIIIRYEI